ncbi:MAG: hypothetical protein KDB86_10560 [Actinobacteria bacterium]|nr:hypothetical protein [Actinomycetota bacterium]MCB9388224.1 hypothetical protein [Acidimicrobiia bacterium]
MEDQLVGLGQAVVGDAFGVEGDLVVERLVEVSAGGGVGFLVELPGVVEE